MKVKKRFYTADDLVDTGVADLNAIANPCDIQALFLVVRLRMVGTDLFKRSSRKQSLHRELTGLRQRWPGFFSRAVNVVDAPSSTLTTLRKYPLLMVAVVATELL